MPTACLRKLCTLFPVLAFAGCDAAPPDPVEAAVRPSVSTPTPPATGIVPASGWPGGVSGEAAYQRHANGAVSFHGGVWTVPLPVRPGDSVADIGFTLEAPTGNAGDPNVIVVELVSSASAAVLSYTNITPMGIGALVNGDTPLSPPRVIASGETLSLVFVPLRANGDYPMSDVKIDATWSVASPRIVTLPLAINGPRVGASPGFQGDALYMSGPVQSAVFQIAGIPVGATLIGARIRVRDSAVGPTRLDADIYPSVDGNQGPSIASSQASNGTGSAQTLSISGLSAEIAPLTTYSVFVNMTTGSAQVSVLGVDIDYRPAN